MDRNQFRRDDPRYPAPLLRREVLRALLGIPPRFDPAYPRYGATADALIRGTGRVEPPQSCAGRMVSILGGFGNDARNLSAGACGNPVFHTLCAVFCAAPFALSQARLPQVAGRLRDHGLVAGDGGGTPLGSRASGRL